MRNFLVVLFIAGLLAGGAAFAQGFGMGQKTFAGATFGVELESGYPFYTAAVHVGAYDVGMQGLGVRVDAAYWLAYGMPVIGVGADALYRYPVGMDVWVYGGLGPRLAYSLSGGGVIWGAAVVAGALYMLTPQVGITGEANVTPYFVGYSTVHYGFSAGVDYYF